MNDDHDRFATALDAVSRKLQQLYSAVLNAERRFAPSGAGLELLDRLANDPAWAWLRPLPALIAEVDHALAQPAELSSAEGAAAAAHIRCLIFGEGDPVDSAFLAHYRSLLQLDHALASTHGELRKLLKTLPDESLNESERLHARHQWAMTSRIPFRISLPSHNVRTHSMSHQSVALVRPRILRAPDDGIRCEQLAQCRNHFLLPTQVVLLWFDPPVV